MKIRAAAAWSLSSPPRASAAPGLGLAMVYGMIQRHSAELEIESAAGNGHDRAAQVSRRTRPRSFRPSERYEQGGAHEPAHCASCWSMMIRCSSNPCKTPCRRTGTPSPPRHGGQAGIDAFAAGSEATAKRFDIVITDLGMPHVDGRKVAASIKAHVQFDARSSC